MPVSISPARTAGLPPVMAWASGVWIWRISHCSGERLSASVAGELGRSPGGGPDASALEAWSSLSLVAKAAVDAAPSTLLSLTTLARKFALADRAIATPIWL